MSTSPPTPAATRLLERLQAARPLVAVELRPPRSDLSHADSIGSWIDANHSIRRLARRDAVVFLTDNAVGQAEEENLHHLESNLEGSVDAAKLVPFLTCKHTLDYCLMYAARAASSGYSGLTVLGGDKGIGPPRCVPHAHALRALIRQRHPQLALGGWANPHADVTRQVDYLLEAGFAADFFLTQVVSHHDLPQVERFVEEARRRGLELPAVFGVFYYRSARPRTLQRLARFLPVPAARLSEEFAAGLGPADVCARTIHRLRQVGAEKVYVSNLALDQAAPQLEAVLERVAALG